MKEMLLMFSKNVAILEGFKSFIKMQQCLFSIPPLLWFLTDSGKLFFPKWVIYLCLIMILLIQFKFDLHKYLLPREIRDFILRIEEEKNDYNKVEKILGNLIEEFELELEKNPSVSLLSMLTPDFCSDGLLKQSEELKNASNERIIEIVKEVRKTSQKEQRDREDIIYDATRLLERLLRKLETL